MTDTAPWNAGYRLRPFPEKTIRTERYPDSYSRRMKSDGMFTKPEIHCERKRCGDTMQLKQTDEGLAYPNDAVVVSLNDGDTHAAFCSTKCAAQWLQRKDK